MLGGILGGAPGAGIGATAGKVGQQQLGQGAHLPTQQEAGQAIKTGATAGVIDLFAGKLVKGAGKLLKGVVTKIDDAFKPMTKPLVDRVNRFILSQTLTPATSKLAREFIVSGHFLKTRDLIFEEKPKENYD